jgi:hypothetical protein
MKSWPLLWADLAQLGVFYHKRFGTGTWRRKSEASANYCLLAVQFSTTEIGAEGASRTTALTRKRRPFAAIA